MLFWIIVAIVIYFVFFRKKNNISKGTGSSTKTYSDNSKNQSMPTTNNIVEKNSTEEIETLDAGEGFGGVPAFYTWNELIPSKVMIKSQVSLYDIRDELSYAMEDRGFDVEFRSARIKYGGALNKTYENCLIMCNPNAPQKYFDFIFTVNQSGEYSIIRTYRSAFSYNNHWMNELQGRKNEDDNVMLVLNFVDNAINKRNIKEYEDGWSIEYLYYTAVQEAVKEIFGI